VISLSNKNYFFNKTSFLEEDQNFNLTNPLLLRTTTRNSIVTFNALQKVFRARFEDGRSNASLEQFSGLELGQPFLNLERIPYENLLGKSNNSFFKVNFYTNLYSNLISPTNTPSKMINYQFFDFPFLLSSKSDMGRYM